MLNPQVLVTKEPVGVVGAIAPWNVPLFIAAAKLAPSLLAGCPVIYKPAPETPFDAFRLAEIFAEAGLPKGVLSVIPAGREVSEHLVTHPGVDKISFTGSGVGGKRIGGLCGERLKRCTLELGGKSAAIILDDADLATTIPTLLPNAIMNNGQACIAQTRILAPRSRYDEVVDAVVAGVAAMQVGDPMDPATEVGPVVAERQRARIEGYLDSGREEGATVAIGGGRPAAQTKGWYVEPTVFTGVDNKMRIAQEEIFGPGSWSSPTTVTTRRSRSPTTRTTGSAARSGPATTTAAWAWPARCARGPTCSMPRCRSTSAPPSAGTRSPAWAASSVPRASRASWRRSRSPCPPATPPRSERKRGRGRGRRTWRRATRWWGLSRRR
jgi:hypothetical protein